MLVVSPHDLQPRSSFPRIDTLTHNSHLPSFFHKGHSSSGFFSHAINPLIPRDYRARARTCMRLSLSIYISLYNARDLPSLLFFLIPTSGVDFLLYLSLIVTSALAA